MSVGACHYGAIRSEALEWLERVEIDQTRIDDRPTTFSSGMQQRLQIARNLVTGPRLIFMDEPTASLDETNRNVVLGLILDAKARGVAIIGIFHDESVLQTVCDRCVDVTNFSAVAA